MTDPRYLDPAIQKLAGEFLNGPLWQEIKRCLIARRPETAHVKDEIHVASAKGHVRAGYELTIAEIEKLPFEHAENATSAFERPAVTITED